ncbi:MAG: hypothetical protein DMD37_09300 [Gemmatimonadetes bacterium]|nr:MAG: hypothetical protein DMD74_01175 [Gemmatimonadota bacterium]PYO70416.1 MAG: hypothetical protein DMD71_02200 [Gemmatimonadota bacterium]PYO86096.1 MAG: hypothetical protein DMD68_01230 [Gemmatimonadota bacterium]PYP62593.1 MAG: hypothetical protein DMD37_09300 [Gemmatimonadota bacterium]
MKRATMIFLILLMGACGERSRLEQRQAGGYQFFSRDSASVAQRARFAAAPAALEAVTVTKAVDLPPIGPSDVTNMVIRTGTAAIEVDSLEPAIAAVRALAIRVGGFVAGTDLETGRQAVPTATLELKIPAARFDEALSGLRPIGKLERVEVTAEDVGEEFVDVSARMENARRLEQRLVTLLAARTGKLSDVLAVERELARVREDIERYEGRIRYLRAHAATSTLSVEVHQPYPVVGTAGTSVVGSAFTQAWRNFVAVMALLIQSLGVVVPLAALAVLGWLAVRSYGRMGRTAV